MGRPGTRTLFWAVGLVLAPALGFGTALSVGSDALAWLLLLGLPPVVTLFAGYLLRIPMAERAVAAGASVGASLFFLLVFLWWLFDVKGVS